MDEEVHAEAEAGLVTVEVAGVEVVLVVDEVALVTVVVVAEVVEVALFQEAHHEAVEAVQVVVDSGVDEAATSARRSDLCIVYA